MSILHRPHIRHFSRAVSRRSLRAAFLMLFLMLSGTLVFAGDPVFVDVLETGTFRQMDEAPPLGLDPCPVNRMVLERHGDTVAPGQDQAFGFVFRIGAPGTESGEAVNLAARFVAVGVSGVESLLGTRRILACPDHPTFAGWMMQDMVSLPAGKVRVELLHQEDMLYEQLFVITGSGMAATPDMESAQLVTSIPAAFSQNRPGNGWLVQVSCCLIRENAENDVERLRSRGYDAFMQLVTVSGTTWHTVRLGGYQDRDSAREAARDFIRNEGRDAYVVSP